MIKRRISELEAQHKLVLERLLGYPLHDDQEVKIEVKELPKDPTHHLDLKPGELPEWCNVFEGLSDEELADLDSAIKRPFYLRENPQP